MSAIELEKRLSAIEREIAELKSRISVPSASPNHWVEKIAGTFSSPSDKLAFDEAMRYGRQWRNAQRPKPHKRKVSGK
jgi:hypothetical protein